MTGYKFKTTFWIDFTIADAFGTEAIKDTYERAFDEWKADVEYLTELVMVLNLKIWQHWENGNEDLAKVYDSLWREADGYALDTLKGSDLRYFYEVLD